MEKFNFKLEFADNGVIVTDNSSGCVNVYQEKKDGNYHECTARAISESVVNVIADLLINGSDKLESKVKYGIKIEIR